MKRKDYEKNFKKIILKFKCNYKKTKLNLILQKSLNNKNWRMINKNFQISNKKNK